MLKETLENSLMEKLTISPIVGKELSDIYIKVNSFRKHKTFDEKFSKSIANPNSYEKPQDLLS